MNQVAKEYSLQLMLSMVAYAVVLTGSIWLLNRGVSAGWQIPLAVAPVVPVLFALRAYLRFLNGVDELQQHIQLNAVGFAAGATGILTFTYGFLENVGFPHLSPIWVLPTMIALWGLASLVVSRRYQ
jgi:hypothetical protein